MIGHVMSEDAVPFIRRPAPIDQEPEQPAVSAHFEPHEENAATAFAQRHDENYRYNHTRGVWLVWNEGVWEEDEKCRADHTMRMMNHRRRLLPDLNAVAFNRMGKVSFSNSALKSAQSAPTISTKESEFDANPYLVACPSGYVDLRTGEMKGHDKNLMFSRRCGVDPADDAANGQWDDFLEQTTRGADGLIDYLQKFCGYSLTGLMNEEIMSFMYGPGGNGKGVFIKAISSVFGGYAISAPAEVFMERQFKGHSTEIARLAGARFITISELGEQGTWDMRFIKEWTGNELKITARFMRQNDFSFDPIGKLQFIGNHKPTIGTVDDATARRLRMIPFMNKPAIVDKKLKDRMVASHPAIMRWVLDGAVKYFSDGHLNAPASVEGVTMSYLQDEDLVTDFIDQFTTGASDNYHILNRDMKLALRLYGEMNGVKAPSTTQVNKKLNDMGIPTSNIKNNKGERCVKRVVLTQIMLNKISERIREEKGRKKAPNAIE